jgi:hypothetical protein
LKSLSKSRQVLPQQAAPLAQQVNVHPSVKMRLVSPLHARQAVSQA